MSESACQRKSVSCGACCGLFNLALDDYAERRALLAARSAEFANTDFGRPATLVDYRARREALEAEITRRDPEIYVCPFLGDLDGTGRAGCLIHPSRSGDPASQNYSFYGASICLAYDCRNKERDRAGEYSQLLAFCFPERDDYARLMADPIFFDPLQRLPGLWTRLLADARADRATPALEAFQRLARARLAAPAARGVSSFEFPRGNWTEPREILGAWLGEVDPAVRESLLADCQILLEAGGADFFWSQDDLVRPSEDS